MQTNKPNTREFLEGVDTSEGLEIGGKFRGEMNRRNRTVYEL